jgi:hypothetical protein
MAASRRRGKQGGFAGRREGKRKSGARSLQPEAHEMGVCVICGRQRQGVPAAPEIPILAARRIRAALGQMAKHTIACREHLAEARQRRANYEKRQRDYLLVAVLFFVLVAAGSFVFGRSDLCLFAPALIGAIFIAALPSLYYSPSFGQ